MPTTLGVPRETFPGERRVALTPRACEGICKLDMSVWIEEGAGLEAGFPDSLFLDRGARIASREKIRRRQCTQELARLLCECWRPPAHAPRHDETRASGRSSRSCRLVE